MLSGVSFAMQIQDWRACSAAVFRGGVLLAGLPEVQAKPRTRSQKLYLMLN
jgi:hypothetical protein